MRDSTSTGPPGGKGATMVKRSCALATQTMLHRAKQPNLEKHFFMTKPKA
jgi:hypothetical protein